MVVIDEEEPLLPPPEKEGFLEPPPGRPQVAVLPHPAEPPLAPVRASSVEKVPQPGFLVI